MIEQLQVLLDALLLQETYESKSLVQKFFLPSPLTVKHVYIHGAVGGGKSMLMDLFYNACVLPKKRRVHFHAFMQETHARLHVLRQQEHHADLIQVLAEELVASTRLLCFDEFLVKDITDAMLLGRLFDALFARGLVVVITSNYLPDHLYANGLQRELFVPFIQLLKQTANIVELCNDKDYRVQHLLTFRQRYYFPLNEYADYLIYQSYATLTNDAPRRPAEIRLLGRSIKLTAVYGDVALSTFKELCAQPLGAADYLLIAREFRTLILADIPRLTVTKRNEAQRFMTLIDVLYDHHIKLICSAEVSAEELYCAEEAAMEFKRTASRLIEMQSVHYLQKNRMSVNNSADFSHPVKEIEGVIKFQLRHTHEPVRIGKALLAELNSWRLLMHRLQMIGQDTQRYDGLAFGNISQRVMRGSDQFYISGTQTSGKALLDFNDVCLVSVVDLPTNSLDATGEVKPSSEALTHASVYQYKKNAQAVIHIHNPEIWQQAAALKLAFTPQDVAYGTPAMALAVAELLNTRILEQSGLFVMLGHVDGVVAFGESLEAASGLIIQAWGRAQQLLLN